MVCLLGCTNLNYIKAHFTDWNSATDPTMMWVTNVSPTGIFVKPSELILHHSGVDSIPDGWLNIDFDSTNTENPDTPAEPIENNSLTFIAVSENSAVKIERKDGLAPFENLYYRTATDETWTEWMEYDSVYSQIIELNNVNDKVQFWNKSDVFSESNTKYASFRLTGSLDVVGNIMSLMNFAEKCYDYCFAYIFYTAGSSLLSAPEFPASDLASGCYFGAFENCTNLKQMPELPATTLQPSCYYKMFKRMYIIRNSYKHRYHRNSE